MNNISVAPSCLRQNRILHLCRRALLFVMLVTLVSPRAYSQGFDLSSLPPYKPEQKDDPQHCHGAVCSGVWGVIRISGTELTQHLIHLWEDNFLKLHPNIRFADYFVPSGFAGLAADTADMNVMGHTAWRSDIKAFEGVFGYEPLEIMFATGGFNERKGNTPGAIIFVSKDNPISKLTLKQLDGIFGTERTGGWKGATWTTESARTAQENIRTWGQLGLTGEWKDKPIHLYGYDLSANSFILSVQRLVFGGGDKWNPALHEFALNEVGLLYTSGPRPPQGCDQLVDALAKDPYGISYTAVQCGRKNPNVKPLAIAAKDGGPYIEPTKENFQNRTYPLIESTYIYINREPGKPVEPKLREFLRYILSRQGQQDVAQDGGYLPLTAEVVREQLKKLE